MAKYKSIVITDSGLALIAATHTGSTIQFTNIKSGNGVYNGTEILKNMTNLKSVKQTFGITGITREAEVVKVRSILTNESVSEGYYLTELGVYALDPNTSSEILYAVIIAEDNMVDYFPPYAEFPQSITLEVYISATGINEGVTFTASIVDGVYVTVKDFEEEVEVLKKSVSDGKTLVAGAITDKGVTTATDATFQTMATNIAAIETNPTLQAKTVTLSTAAQTIRADSGYDGLSQVIVPAVTGTAITTNVLKGKTFASAAGVNLTGTMVDNGAVNQALNAGGSYTIPAGFHNGSGKVTANSLKSQTSATATAAQILSPQTAFVNGTKITGSMVKKVPDYGDQLPATIINYGAGSGNSTEYLYSGITSNAYYEGVNYIRTPASGIANAIDLQPYKIVSGYTVLGVSGAGGGKKYATGTDFTLVTSSDYYAYYTRTDGSSTYTSHSNRIIKVIPPFNVSMAAIQFTLGGGIYTANLKRGNYSICYKRNQVDHINHMYPVVVKTGGSEGDYFSMIQNDAIYFVLFGTWYTNNEPYDVTWEVWE